MVQFDIPNRFTGGVQLTAEIGCAEDAPRSVKVGLAVRWAVKNGADLRGANLMDANLMDADLEGADLEGANLMDANLRYANLMDADLRGANLMDANLMDANLMDANLMDANLWSADLRDADLEGANLNSANLTRADLRGANLRGTNLTGADLMRADLRGAKNSQLAEAQTSILPAGDIIGWKKAGGYIVKMLIPADAKRSNATGRKCRAEYADVLEVIGAAEAVTDWFGPKTIYRPGERVHADKWDQNRWDECSNGIHFFITREEAEAW